MNYQPSEKVEELRAQLAAHPVYAAVDTPEKLRLFAGHHVFCVWDFMQLLTGLQRHFTCTTIPWTPPRCNPETTRLVNEIVLGEESDLDGAGGHCSHFTLYLRAMAEMGASRTWVEDFLVALGRNWTVRSALAMANVPVGVEAFVRETMRVVDGDDPLELAATFAYGRETMIPGMFVSLLDAGHELPELFRFYLERHGELDGEEHGAASVALVDELVTDVEAHGRADRAAIAALSARVELWDAVRVAVDELA